VGKAKPGLVGSAGRCTFPLCETFARPSVLGAAPKGEEKICSPRLVTDPVSRPPGPLCKKSRRARPTAPVARRLVHGGVKGNKKKRDGCPRTTFTILSRILVKSEGRMCQKSPPPHPLPPSSPTSPRGDGKGNPANREGWEGQQATDSGRFVFVAQPTLKKKNRTPRGEIHPSMEQLRLPSYNQKSDPSRIAARLAWSVGFGSSPGPYRINGRKAFELFRRGFAPCFLWCPVV